MTVGLLGPGTRGVGQQDLARSAAVQQQPTADPARDLNGAPGWAEHDTQGPVTVENRYVAGFAGRLAQGVERLVGGRGHIHPADRLAEVRERQEADPVDRSLLLHDPAFVGQGSQQSQDRVLVDAQALADLRHRQRFRGVAEQFQQPDTFPQRRASYEFARGRPLPWDIFPLTAGYRGRNTITFMYQVAAAGAIIGGLLELARIRTRRRSNAPDGTSSFAGTACPPP